MNQDTKDRMENRVYGALPPVSFNLMVKLCTTQVLINISNYYSDKDYKGKVQNKKNEFSKIDAR